MNWFTETLETDLGRQVQVEYKKILASSHSDFQHVEVYETVPYGKMLVLDGVIQLTEFDHFAYHEMLIHIPMNAHPHPKSLLIVGGGDGGALAEAIKHPSLETIVLCEIDKTVIDVSRKHFPEFDKAFEDKRLTVIIRDAAEYLKNTASTFDIIAIDSSDPIGPAEILFQEAFYRDVFSSLTEEGIAVSQSESMFYHQDFIATLLAQNKMIFPVNEYYYTLVPTYPSGTIGFSFCSKTHDPTTHLNADRVAELKGLKYYSQPIHQASFVLPAFMRDKLAH